MTDFEDSQLCLSWTTGDTQILAEPHAIKKPLKPDRKAASCLDMKTKSSAYTRDETQWPEPSCILASRALDQSFNLDAHVREG